MRQQIGQAAFNLPPIESLRTLMQCSIQPGLPDINLIAKTRHVHIRISLLACSASSIDVHLKLLYQQAHNVHFGKLPLDGDNQQWVS